nr:integrase core domain-containing protein [Streptomyces vinaceus]
MLGRAEREYLDLLYERSRTISKHRSVGGGVCCPPSAGRLATGWCRRPLSFTHEWAYQRPYTSDRQRQEAFTDWIDWHNYHRPHTGVAGQTPASRATNHSGQHT